MNIERFRESPSGYLVPTTLGEVDSWAFVPNPLPPDLAVDWEMARALSAADRALSELAGLGRTMPNPHLLIGPFIRREAVLSSRIEGTQADIVDLYAYEAGQLYLPGFAPPRPEADLREVRNYVRAMEYGLERMGALPVSLRLVRELHEHLLQGGRGERSRPGQFRQGQNYVGRPGDPATEARFVPPPVPEMLQALDAFEKYLHSPDTHPPLVHLAFIHYQFEAIHPFSDGNGRIGRLLVSLLLIAWDLLPLPLLYLSAYFERLRQDYYDLLLAVSEQGAWPEWVLFFLRGVEEQARDAVARVKRLQDLQLEWRERLRREHRSGLVLDLGDTLFASPLVSANDVARQFQVSHPAAMLALRRLEEMGLVEEISGRQRNRLYLARAIVTIIE